MIIEIEKLGLDLDNEICTLIIKDRYVIAHKEDLPLHRLRFGIAHEFGHILLQHLDFKRQLDHEKEANMFAARILTPLIVLKTIESNTTPLTPNYISNLCGVSLEAANNRLKRLREVETRNKFITSKLEQQVLKQFNKFIKEQRK